MVRSLEFFFGIECLPSLTARRFPYILFYFILFLYLSPFFPLVVDAPNFSYLDVFLMLSFKENIGRKRAYLSI